MAMIVAAAVAAGILPQVTRWHTLNKQA